MKGHDYICAIAFVCVFCIATACHVNDYFPFLFSGEMVRQVELIQLEPSSGIVQKREVLAETKINEFVSTLRRSSYNGAYNEPMPYLLKLKLGGDQTAELKATDRMVSDWNKNYYYNVDLKQFFPKFFELGSSAAPPNKALRLTAR
jgi:hypothetical protein